MLLDILKQTISELTLKPGIYRLVNLQSNTALDLSEGDGRTLIGWTKHNNPNQQFIFIPLGHGGGYVIQNAWNGSYATIEDGICTGTPIVGNAFPATWVLEECPQWLRGERTFSHDGSPRCFRIRWPNSRYVIDLEGYGCTKDGTKIQLAYEQTPIHPCQVWRFEEVSSSTNSSSPLGYSILASSDMTEDEDVDDDNEDFHDASEDGFVLAQNSSHLPLNLSEKARDTGAKTSSGTTKTTMTYTVTKTEKRR